MITLSNTATRATVTLNIELLEEAVEVLSSMDDTTYIRPADLFGGQRIGGHIRHIVEFYECLFEGVANGTIDYAARRRDIVVELHRSAALDRLKLLRDRLRGDDRLNESTAVWVQPEDSVSGCVSSSLGREMEAIASHTVHHFALIAVLLRFFGFETRSDFGVSKATLRYRAGSIQHQAA